MYFFLLSEETVIQKSSWNIGSSAIICFPEIRGYFGDLHIGFFKKIIKTEVILFVLYFFHRF